MSAVPPSTSLLLAQAQDRLTRAQDLLTEFVALLIEALSEEGATDDKLTELQKLERAKRP